MGDLGMRILDFEIRTIKIKMNLLLFKMQTVKKHIFPV